MNTDFAMVNSTLVSLFPSATRTSSINGTGVDVSEFDGMAAVILDSGAGVGTMDITLQDSADNVTFVNIPGVKFDQVTTTAVQKKININIAVVKKFLRAAIVLASAPQFTFSVNLLAVKQYT
ncbi:MAG: hypothetical protein ACHBMF_03755 [Chromatiales bacterium]